MLRVFLLAVAAGLFGALAGGALAHGTKLFREVGQHADFVPLIVAVAFALVGAIAGATDAVVQAIRRSGDGRGRE